ncbi:MAG: response regulator [Cyanobacteria bacterium CRU_2_1]|nr:response regulator [Cyanobacteria bacterium RU_5_0]NJR62739.1 response regulator [Cyanobacteria bacterium CRU_2_1]
MSTRQILVIDDEANVREVVQACLRDLGGWDVLEAASGREGLIKAAEEQPDAIVLDLMMPGMDGFAVLRQLQLNPMVQSIPVVVLTAKTYLIERRQFAQFGVVEAIAKPFNPVMLPIQIAKALGWEQKK